MSTMTIKGVIEMDVTTRRPSALFYCIYVEVMKSLRNPMFTVFTVLFPTLLFAMFALPTMGQGPDGSAVGQYLLASFGTYAVMGVALFSFGASVASERGMGWNKLLRATSLQPMTYFLAKVVMALLFGLATLTVLSVFAAVIGHVRIPLDRWGELIGLQVLGMIPFVALGLWVGYTAGPSSSAVLANLINLPLSFASGVFIPLAQLPHILQQIAPYLPSYHTAQLGWTLLGIGDGKGLVYHLLWMAAYTVIFLVFAVLAYKRDEGKTFG